MSDKESKHTPGPWSCMVTSELDGSPYVDDGVHSCSPETSPGDIICLSPEREGYTDSAERWEANALLIAAAPDLLAALLPIAERGEISAKIIKNARAAIAKAQGAA